MSSKPKRKLIVEDDDSSSSEEEEQHRQPVSRPQRAATLKSTSSAFAKSGREALDDILQEEDVSMWKEEEEDERDQRLHFVVDDDGAGYLDDDVDHQGKEYATYHSDNEDEEASSAAAAAAAAADKKKKRAKLLQHQQQDLFSMFTKVERKTEDMKNEVPETPMAAGEEEEEDTDALMQALLSSSSKSAKKSTTSAVKRKPVAPIRAAKPPVVRTYQRQQPQPQEEEVQEDQTMIFGDEGPPPEEQQQPTATTTLLAQDTVEKEVPQSKPQSTRAKLLAAAAARQLPIAQAPLAPIAAELEALPEETLVSGTFAASTATTAALALPTSQAATTFPKADSDTDAIEFFWTDIYENKPGELFLFGRVETTTAAEQNSTSSCCVQLKHISRSLVVLPSFQCNTAEDKKQVVDEVLQAIRMNRLEKSALEHMRFKTKWVKRSYAFELPDIPRGEHDYLLVEYSMLCERQGAEMPLQGHTYSHVFGANQSTVERFLLANRVMGPCWLRFESPAAPIQREKQGSSHCKYECELDMCKLTIVQNKPAPSVSVLSLALKTFVDPTTHQHQIVVATGVVHSNIPLDLTSEALNEDATQVKFQLIRPINPQELDRYRNLKFTHPNVMFQPNERALLSCLLAMMHSLDVDFVCGHNIEGFELDLLLSRLKYFNIKQWSKLGRLNLSRFPNSSKSNGRQSHFGVLTPGRLIVDTYTSSQEFLLGQREYSLTSLCESVGVLKTRRQDLDPSHVPQMFHSPQGLLHLLNHNVETCQLQLKLAFKLEVFTLTLELTAIAGNLWRRTLGSGRAERIEYLLSHAFFNQDFIVPDKEPANKNKKKTGRAAPSYAGGLVLDPKPGLYDTFVVLLDFNALYPSIIQEYNICFTTVQRPAVENEAASTSKRSKLLADNTQQQEEEEEEEELPIEDADGAAASQQQVEEVPLPLDNGRGPQGLAILPRVIQNIVDRRKQVQAQLAQEPDALKRRQMDTRQKALKITANSMYGCLGFSSSRYFARPLASLITSQGRMILMDTVETTERLGFKVLYGDTDSIMIDTQLRNNQEAAPVMRIADEIIRAVNPKYKYLKIALDGVFKTLLLLKKKKYASLKLVLSKLPQQVETRRETKGLDLVRRDWCPASQRLGSRILDHILDNKDKEEICLDIRNTLLSFKDKLQEMPLSEFTITKGLNKHPKDYPDSGKGNPHVQVAKRMLERSKVVNVGDHIPFVICRSTEQANAHMAARAYHPDEVAELNLEVDFEWYVSTQMFPPVQRLVEVMDGITSGEVATALGMDATKFQQALQGNSFQADAQAAHFDSIFGQTFQADIDRFALCDKISLACPECAHEFEFAGVCRLPVDTDALELQRGTTCPQCNAQQVVDSIVLQNLLTLNARKAIGEYYRNQLVPKDAMVEAEFKTRQLGLRDFIPYNKRRIALKRELTSKQLWIQLYYLVCLVDCERFEGLLVRENEMRKRKGQAAFVMQLPKQDREELKMVKDHLERTFLHNSAFGWVEPELFQRVFRLPSAAAGAAEDKVK